MRLFGINFGWERKGQVLTLDQMIRRLDAVYQTTSGIQVTPETAMESPTVHAIVTAIANRISVLPVHVIRKVMIDGRETKEHLPNHPVARLLNNPNDRQDRVTFWLDAASWLVRYGNFYAWKGRGSTGPIRRLEAFPPYNVDVVENEERDVTYRVRVSAGGYREFGRGEMLHARGGARDGLVGNSPVMDVRESIALEIAAERMGATFFGNGAMPGFIFKTLANMSDEQRRQFLTDFTEAYSGRRRFNAMLLPKGVELGDAIALDNEKAQSIETRKHQRTVIAGAFGVPPHLVGDLERTSINNFEQQSLDFSTNVILPYVQRFEAAMERDLLTMEDRDDGVCIRFNVDAAVRADFKSRVEGEKLLREAGVVTPNEIRERMGWNPLPDGQGGDDVWQQGPSGQSGPTADDDEPEDEIDAAAD